MINGGNSSLTSRKGGVSVSVCPLPFSPPHPPVRPPSHAWSQKQGSERVQDSPRNTEQVRWIGIPSLVLIIQGAQSFRQN